MPMNVVNFARLLFKQEPEFCAQFVAPGLPFLQRAERRGNDL